jgi:RHS repeat-associated protein
MWTWFSDPFGTTAINSNPQGAGTFTYNLRFPGQLFDADTGLSYNMARDYDPAVGRYAESDPIGLKGGTNTYAYVLDDPIMSVDPLGLTTTVTVRCGSLPASMGGSSGGVYCEVVAVCDKSGERVAFGIGGGGNGIWDRLFGGKTPPKYTSTDVPAAVPKGIDSYSAACGSGDDCGCDPATLHPRIMHFGLTPIRTHITCCSSAAVHYQFEPMDRWEQLGGKQEQTFGAFG